MANRARALAPFLALLLALAPALALAQDGVEAPPAEATEATVGPVNAALWVVNATTGEAIATVAPGDTATVRLFLNHTGTGNVTVEDAVSAAGNATVPVPAGMPANVTLAANGTLLREWTLQVPADAANGTSVGVTAALTVTPEGPNATAAQDSLVYDLTVIAPAQVPPVDPVAPGPNYTLIGGAALAVLVVAAGAGYAVTKRRRPAPVRRSQTLQRMDRERQVERAKTVEEREELQEAIREEEQQKSINRDLAILHAKRQDVLKMMDLLRKRHEAGQLTQLQYQKMVERKQADLDRLDAEIAGAEGSA